MKGLMTPSDVIKYSGVKLDTNPCSFRELYGIEYKEARTCIGLDLWNAMIDAKVDYSDVQPYASGTSYSIGDVVSYNGIYRKATEVTESLPSSSSWDDAPIFEGDCAEKYNELFCTFLAPYFAHHVLSIRLPYIWTQIKDIGVFSVDQSGQKSVDSKAYDRVMAAILRDKEIAFNNLDFYLNDDESDCFDDYAGKETTCSCDDKGCSKCNNYSKVGRYRFG